MTIPETPIDWTDEGSLLLLLGDIHGGVDLEGRTIAGVLAYGDTGPVGRVQRAMLATLSDGKHLLAAQGHWDDEGCTAWMVRDTISDLVGELAHDHLAEILGLLAQGGRYAKNRHPARPWPATRCSAVRQVVGTLPCPECSGSGRDPVPSGRPPSPGRDGTRACPECGGSGKVTADLLQHYEARRAVRLAERALGDARATLVAACEGAEPWPESSTEWNPDVAARMECRAAEAVRAGSS